MSAAHPQPDYSTPFPRRAQIYLTELELKALLGLAPDESLRAVVFDPVLCATRIVVESPRLPENGTPFSTGRLPGHDVEPMIAKLPLSDSYEKDPVPA